MDNEELNKSLETEGKKNQDNKASKANIRKEILSWVILVAVAYLMAFVITNFVIIKTEIISGSMKNTLNVDDRVVGFRLSYLFSEPERGDVIFFEYPDDESQTFVKRIIGLPGDVVTITGGKVYINDVLLDEPYLREKMDEDDDLEFTVPEDSYFCMGDNRNHSLDSRYWDNHFVSKDEILAKAWFRYKPTLDLVESATYD